MPSNIIAVTSPDSFTVNGLKFRTVRSNYQAHRTSADEIIILKDAEFLRSYDALFNGAPIKNVLEFGVFEGGSLIYFALAFPAFKFVGIDIRKPNTAVLDHIFPLGLEERIKIYYESSQSDRNLIRKIIEHEFHGKPIGIVIDDASHQYRLSKTSFEVSFGALAPNGVYCIEDWAWAHWDEPFQTQQWVDSPALTNLLFEILILYPSWRGLIKRMDILSNVTHVYRGEQPMGQFTVDLHLRMRGKNLTLI